MIRCRILGPIGLSGPDGQPIDDVVAQPRRLALLAYLAMQAPRGFTRRDALFPLFWPELDQDRARGALRQALHVLRSGLGDGVVVSRGTEEVSVSTEQVWCDAVEFERACDDRNWASALDLYRGDFLEAFYITEAPQFEQWMQEQQGRLRLRAVAAVRSLAAEQEAAGDLISATATVRRALAMNSADEESLRHLITLLDQQGDRVGALQEYDAFMARLTDEFAVQPSAETKALLERVRQREHVLRPEVATPASSAPMPSASSRPDLLPRANARGRRMWAAAAVVVLLGGATLWRADSVARLAAADAPERVAILPFAMTGIAEHRFLREALVDLLSTDLDGAGGIQTIDPKTVRAAAADIAEPGPEDGRSLARKLEARYFVLGRVVAVGARLRVQSSLYDLRAGNTPLAQASREGTAEQLFEMVDGLATDLLVGSRRVANVRLSESAARTTHSLAAFKAYLDGERAFHVGDFASSISALRRAVAIDSTFALASYRLSVVIDDANESWMETLETAERALRHAKRLSERDRVLLEAHFANLTEDVVESERRYRSIVVRYPDELEAWYRLGEVIFHQNTVTARPLADARAPFERVLQLDPSNRSALQHLARIAATEHRTAELDTLYRRVLAAKLGPAQEAETRSLHVFAGGSAADREAAFADLATARGGAAVSSWVISAFTDDLDAYERIMRARTRPPHSSAVKSSSYDGLAWLYAVRGQMDRAAIALGDVERLRVNASPEQGALVAILPFRTTPERELRAWRARVAAWNPQRGAAGSMNNNSISGPWSPHIRLYLLGQLDALLGDTAAARADADSLDRIALPQVRDSSVFAKELAASVRATTLWRQGKGAAALALLEKSPQAKPFPYRGAITRTQDRYVRAELLFEAGRYADALTWYSTFEYTGIRQLVYAVPAHLRRGQIHEKLGNPQQAVTHYRRFLDYWRLSDSAYRPMTALAEERLRHLPK